MSWAVNSVMVTPVLFSPNLETNWQFGEKIGEKRTRTARNAHPSGVGKTDEVICNESEHRL